MKPFVPGVSIQYPLSIESTPGTICTSVAMRT
jgi:hypothetical protein